jgi:hypothetical protein
MDSLDESYRTTSVHRHPSSAVPSNSSDGARSPVSVESGAIVKWSNDAFTLAAAVSPAATRPMVAFGTGEAEPGSTVHAWPSVE